MMEWELLLVMIYSRLFENWLEKSAGRAAQQHTLPLKLKCLVF